MKKFLFFGIFLLIGIGLFIWIFQQVDLSEIILRFNFLNWGQVAILFILSFCRFGAWVFRWRLILGSMGEKNIPLKTLIGARLGEMSISYLTPGLYYGGEIIRILALKKKTKVSTTKGISSVAIDRIIDIGSFGLFAFLGAFIFLFKANFFWALAFVLLGICPLILIFIILRIIKSDKLFKIIKLLKIQKISGRADIIPKVKEVQRQILDFFKKSKKIVRQGIIFSFIAFLTGAIQISLFTGFLGEKITFFNSILVRVLSLFSTLVPIPATLGVLEGANIIGFKMLNLTAETGLSFTLFYRFIDFTLVATGLFIIIYYFTHKTLKSLNGWINGENK